MPAAFDVARDEIYGQFYAAWAANAPAVNDGVEPDVFWDGIGEPENKPHASAWARAQIRHTGGAVVGVGGPINGRRRTEKRGVVTVQIFAPLFDDDGSARGTSLCEELSKVAKAAFEAQTTASGVIFRRTRIIEVGPDGPWFQMNVLAEFEYDEFV